MVKMRNSQENGGQSSVSLPQKSDGRRGQNNAPKPEDNEQMIKCLVCGKEESKSCAQNEV